MSARRISEQQARKLASGDYGRASLEDVASHAVPFFVVRLGTISPRNLAAGRRLLANGTAFDIDLGREAFAVTANHVVECAMEPPVVKRGLFPKRFEPPALPLVELDDLKERVIARSAERDIATFRLSREEVAKLKVSPFSSPPMVPIEGVGGVAFAGYPCVQPEIQTVQQGPDGPELTLSWAVFPGLGIAA